MPSLFPLPLLDALRQAPGAPAFEHAGRIVSRAELLDLVTRLSVAFRDTGLGPGSGLAMRTSVTPEAFAAYVAAFAVGCRVVAVRPGYPPAQLAHVLDSGVEFTLTDEVLGDLLGRGGGGKLVVTARPEDVAALVFTSGSTGRPKGCAITYRALSEHWAWQPERWGPVAAELAAGFGRCLLFGTLASMVVLEFLAPCLLGGGTAVIPDDDGRPLFPHAIERHRITGSIITVPRLGMMLDHLAAGRADVSSLRALMISGSPLAPARLAEAAARLGPVTYQGYGQTEAGNVAMLTPDDVSRGLLDSVGRPHPGVELDVRGGEIHVRSPYLMSGYWGQEEETGLVLRDGWLATRDLGFVDAAGYLYLTGRSRDVAMVNAMVVYLGPVERVLAGHPGVLEAYVVGAPDGLTGEAVHAFVVPAGPVDEDALRGLVRAELGADSVPRTITVVPAVPMAESGKPDKRALLRLL
ncbi:MAG: long-chain fatty acid--CoA ligase [Nonomuraea sp.]|nr:long-chain fatty acid--CoA ligase [Nonomuraea sp.]